MLGSGLTSARISSVTPLYLHCLTASSPRPLRGTAGISILYVRNLRLEAVSALSAHTAIPGPSWNRKPCVSKAQDHTLNPFALLPLSTRPLRAQ